MYGIYTDRQTEREKERERERERARARGGSGGRPIGFGAKVDDGMVDDVDRDATVL